ncbi:MAG: TraY domain-containing protein [Lactobacillus sp.]|nr:TraY domain-containing protein [Lactobacillus sp.]
MLSIRLPKEMEQRLTVLANATQRPKSFYVREALERSLEDIEDVYLAETAYERFKTSGDEAIPLKEVMSEYGLES